MQIFPSVFADICTTLFPEAERSTIVCKFAQARHRVTLLRLVMTWRLYVHMARTWPIQEMRSLLPLDPTPQAVLSVTLSLSLQHTQAPTPTTPPTAVS